MTYDFDTQLALKGAHCAKYDSLEKVFGTDDADTIPMWVADMDFPASPEIIAAVKVEAERGYFGYFGDSSAASQAVAGWYDTRHGWAVDPNCVRFTHGVISGFADVLATFSELGDRVILFAPVYHAFYRQVAAMGREILESPLVLKDGQFCMDLAALRGSMTGREKILTICSPHNPGGKIWSDDELQSVADFCGEHGLILVSDEVHMDLVFPGASFTPTAIAAPNIVDRLVVITAASKGFNIAGGETGLLIAPNAGLRAKLDRTITDRESSPNRFGMAMVTAAFAQSADWSDAVCAYIAENFRIFADRMNALPGVSVMEMQSTYLTWVDFSSLGMTDRELMDRTLGAKVAPSPGIQFGTGGSGHLRFNVALPRKTMLEALDRLETAFGDVQ